MIVPNAEKAVVDIRKLRDYCLNPNHEVGKHKARVFASALGLTIRDAPLLQKALLDTVKSSEAEISRIDKYGRRYTVDFAFIHREKSAIIRSVWMIDADSDIPRLVTCLIL